MHTLLSPLLASGFSPFPTRAHDGREEHSPLPPPPPTERERERACFHSQKRSELSGGGGGGQRQQRLQVPSPPRAPPQHRNPTPTLHCKARRGEAGPSAVGLREEEEEEERSWPRPLRRRLFSVRDSLQNLGISYVKSENSIWLCGLC